MASKTQQLMADRLLKCNVAAAAKKAKNTVESSGKDSEGVSNPTTRRLKTDSVPEGKDSLTETTTPTDDKGKEKIVIGVGLPASDMSEEEVRHHLAVQGRRVFGQKSEKDMTYYLNTMSEWCTGREMLAHTSAKRPFYFDELKMQAALGQAAADELELLKTEVKELKAKDEESQKEIEKLGKLWEELAEWYHAQPGGNVECEFGDKEPANPVIEADAEEDEGLEEKEAANEEKVDPQAGGE
ncbi:putative perilipin-3-like [Sesbania bispinosa]|nr:putative perilipin-3-like [Sesbania bispinosa]